MIFGRFWIEIKFKVDNIHFLLLTLSSNNGHPLQRVDLTLKLIIELIMQFRKYHKTATHLKSSMTMIKNANGKNPNHDSDLNSALWFKRWLS